MHNNKHPTPPVISLPKLKSVPNQVVSTPRRLLQPIHNQGWFVFFLNEYCYGGYFL